MPKTGLSVRPGSSFEIEDHIVFFGIAYLLAPVLDRVLPDSFYSTVIAIKKGAGNAISETKSIVSMTTSGSGFSLVLLNS